MCKINISDYIERDELNRDRGTNVENDCEIFVGAVLTLFYWLPRTNPASSRQSFI